jgi:hypothetical protein
MHRTERRTARSWLRARWRAATLAVCGAALAAAFGLALPDAARAAPACGRPDQQGDPTFHITAKQAGWGKLIQLRYNTRNRCAWGRIVNSSGDETIWVDHSTTHGNGWEGPLSVTTCRRPPFFPCPYNSWFTDGAYNDAGAVMRACAQVASGGIICTEWF